MANESAVLVVTGSESSKRPTATVALVIDEIPGYDPAETQVLQHISGVLTWVDAA